MHLKKHRKFLNQSFTWLSQVIKYKGFNQINLYFLGHVNSGKSTLIGHLLSLHNNKKEHHQKNISDSATKYAWLLDESKQERERGMTMEVGIKEFTTEKKRILFMDSPGHKDFLSQMICASLMV